MHDTDSCGLVYSPESLMFNSLLGLVLGAHGWKPIKPQPQAFWM